MIQSKSDILASDLLQRGAQTAHPKPLSDTKIKQHNKLLSEDLSLFVQYLTNIYCND